MADPQPSVRAALIVATGRYDDPALSRLRAPAQDAADLAEVLANPDIGDFTVTSVIDSSARQVRLSVADFVANRDTQDLLLVYLSCHGILDARRRLYFATTDTFKDRLSATGIEAAWVLDELGHCRARRQVLILDSCFSGAFANRAKGPESGRDRQAPADVGLKDLFLGQGRGRAVLTASTATEYSFEGEPTDPADTVGSVFTTALVTGLRTGAADADQDGYISVDDAYAYVYDQVQATGAHQTPQRWLYGAEGKIWLARNPAGAAVAPVRPRPRRAGRQRSTRSATGAEPPVAATEARSAGQRATSLPQDASALAPFSGGLHQPMLFVGLGGAGCDIGVVIERSLRKTICGPDGMDLMRSMNNAALLPYQLPSCLQFVYADLNHAGLFQMAERVVPGPEHASAARQTARYVSQLVPMADNYPELAGQLRLRAMRIVESWLPPRGAAEPDVGPLSEGAGQFPTVGRAALFGALSHGPTAVTTDLVDTVRRLATSAKDLHHLGGGPLSAVDVFVAFSVAGGTGCGIFYDFIHLIGQVFENSGLRALIFPLVLLPSAFRHEHEDLRTADLNAAQALVDLFRLVDAQNRDDSSLDLRGAFDNPPAPDNPHVRYPFSGRIELRPGMVSTGFLFSLPPGVERSDLYASVAALVTSLIGGEPPDSEERLEARHYQSFADSFINSMVSRGATAGDAIGSRGVSTAQVAALTMPADEIAEIIADRMLRTAIEQMSMTPDAEDEPRLAEEFIVASGAAHLLTCPGVDISEPLDTRRVMVALNDRLGAMREGLSQLRIRLDQDMPQIARGFDPRQGAQSLLSRADPFCAYQVIFGNPGSQSGAGSAGRGTAGMLDRKAQAPAPPPGADADTPKVPELDDGAWPRRHRWTDPPVAGVRDQQDQWYRWRTEVMWSEAWSAHKATWRRQLTTVERELRALLDALGRFAKEDQARSARRGRDLYKPRVGVSYLLPPGSADLDGFHDHVISALTEEWAYQGRIGADATVADLVDYMIGSSGWRVAYNEFLPTQAVNFLRNLVKGEVEIFLRSDKLGQLALLPRLHDLLEAASGSGMKASLLEAHLEDFRSNLASLVPARFAPEGSGPLRILITYPAVTKSLSIEEYLTQTINLPRGQGITYELQPTRFEAISVVFLRTLMGLTDVPEARKAIKLWSSALADERTTDKLPWRQRISLDFYYLATREKDRAEILHHLLCALWNGRVTIQGPPQSPAQVQVRLDGGVSLTLDLTSRYGCSSWSSVLHAYERLAFDDDTASRQACEQLMQEEPNGLTYRPEPPSDLYRLVRQLAEPQAMLANEVEASHPEAKSWAYHNHRFWAETMDAALSMVFRESHLSLAANLREMEALFE